MIIHKIKEINNAFSYHKYHWDNFHNQCNDAAFSQANLLYGENGNGKTSIINIFKCLNGNESTIEKHRDVEEEEQSIILSLQDNSVINFNGEIWSNSVLRDRFLIFDKFFIERYVHSLGSDSVDNATRRQQRGKNIVYLGNFHNYNIEIEKILKLKNKINEKNRQFKLSYERELLDKLRGTSLTEDEIYQTDFFSEINSIDKSLLPEFNLKLDSVEKEKETIIRIIRDKEKILNIQFLKPCATISDINYEKISNLFSFSLSPTIKSIIEEIQCKKDFIRMGLPYLISNPSVCPYCERKVEDDEVNNKFKLFIDLFDKSFQEKELEVNQGLEEYEQFLHYILHVHIPPENSLILEKMSNYLSIECSFPTLDFFEEIEVVINHELSLIKQKKEALLDKQISWDKSDIFNVIRKYQDFTTIYNPEVSKVNDLIANLKNKVQNSQIELSLKEKESVLNNTKKKIEMITYKDDILRFYYKKNISKNNDLVIQALDRIYLIMKDKIIDKFKDFVNDYFEIINKYVLELSPTMKGIEIVGTAKVDARNEREPFQCGFDIKYLGTESNWTFSEGEKQVVALSYFFAQLEKESDKNKILVFDDPISNFDAGKRWKTSEIIFKFSKVYSQTFLFTCDPLFREYSVKIMENRALFYIYKTRGFSAIHYISKRKMDVCSSFEEDFRRIGEEHGTIENIIIYGNKLRYCLEIKIKEGILGYSKDSLKDVITHISKNEGEKYKKIIEHKEELLNIYQYCNSGGISHFPRESAPNWNELVYQINNYLQLDL